MDPVSYLPPEVMEKVWNCLQLSDLLNCRLVAASWNGCLVSDPVWKRYLVGNDYPSWNGFLKMKKMDYYWNHGICKTYTADISETQFVIGGHYIYMASEKAVKCFTPTLQEVYSFKFDNNIVGIHPFSDMVAFVLFEEKFKYRIRIYKGLTPIRNFETNVNRISAGFKVICFQVQNTVVVFDGKTVKTHNLPGDVVEVIATNDRLLVKTVSSVSMGSNCSFYLHGPEGWEMVWKGRNSPMGCMFGHLEATSHYVALVGGTQTDSGYNYSGLHILGRGIVDCIEPSRTAYFRSYSCGDTLVYTKSERSVRRMSTRSWTWEQTDIEPGLQLVRTRGPVLILIYQERWRLSVSGKGYWRQGPLHVEGAAVRQDFLAIWSKSSLHIFDFSEQDNSIT